MRRAQKPTRRDKRRKRLKAAAESAPSVTAAEDEIMEAIGFDAKAFMADEERETREALLAERSLEALSRSMQRSAGSAEQVLKRVLEVLPPDPPIACGDGCAHCCYLRAEASAPEVLRLSAHLRATLPPERFEALRVHAIDTARRIGNWDTERRAEARVACALLDGNRCIAYEVRPLVCRACNASDPDTCERALVDPDATTVVYAPQKALYRYAATAAARALSAQGLAAELFELNAALAWALSTTDAAERWLRGERIFTDRAGEG